MRAAPQARPQADDFRPPFLSLVYSGAWSLATRELYFLGQNGWEWGTLAAFVTGGIAIGQLVKAMNDGFKKALHDGKVKRLKKQKNEQGQSQFATLDDVIKSPVLSNKQGIFLGTLATGKRSTRDVFYDGANSISIFASPNELKTMSILASTLFANREGNWIVNDPTGELASICGPALLQAGYDIYFLSPFADKVEQQTGQKITDVGLDIFSAITHETPLHLIRPELKKSMKWVIPNRADIEEKNLHFYRGARNLGMIVSMKELAEGRIPTLPAIRHHLMQGPSRLYELFQEAEGSTAFGGVYEELAMSALGIMQSAPQQFAGSFGTAEQFFDPFDHCSSLGAHTEGSSWDPRVLKHPHKKVAVFVIYTLEMMEAYASSLAMTMNYLFDTVAADTQAGTVTALLDEAGLLRFPLAEKLDFYRKMGLRVAMVWQDMAQGEANHGKTGLRRILAASKLKVFMGLQEPEMLQMASKLCGTKSYSKLQLNDRAGVGSSMPDLSPSLNNEGVPLLRDEEVRMLDADTLLLVGDRLHPLLLKKLPWWERPKWKKIAGPSPFYRG